MAINYKLNFCRITLASKLFVRNNYFPLFKIITPQDATREIIKNSFTPKNHYMPVLLSHKKRQRLSGGKKIKQIKNYGKRLHSKIDDFNYMSVMLNMEDEKHKKLLDILKTKKSITGNYVYKVEERNTCLVFDGQLEEAARNGDIEDITISDNTDRMIIRLKTGVKIIAEANNLNLEDLLFWGEAATTEDIESRHHYGKMIMSIAHIFEMKERSAALYELEKIKFEAKKRQKVEREWKSGLEPLIENLVRENEAEKENDINNNELHDIENKEFKMKCLDVNRTLNASERLLNSGVENVQKLPIMKEINHVIKKIGDGYFTEICDIPGVIVKIGDDEIFLIGQMFENDHNKYFVPGQTFETTNGVKYLPGVTVNLDNTPTFVAGIIMADDTNSAVFLPGQSFITNDGVMKFTKEGERVTPVGMKKLQMTEDEQWERVEKRKLARDKLEREKLEKQRERKKAKKGKTDRKNMDKIRMQKEKQNKEKQELMQLETCQTTLDSNKETINTDQNKLTEEVRTIDNLNDFSEPPSAATDSVVIETDRTLEEETKMEFDKTDDLIILEEMEHQDDINNNTVTEEMIQNEMYLLEKEKLEKNMQNANSTDEFENCDEQRKFAIIVNDMRDVIEKLEMKKSKLLEKLKNIQNETCTQETREITYIYPAKANAVAVELGYDGQIARNIAKILLGITRWANTFSAKFHVHSENIDIISYSSEIDDAFYNCSDNLKSALKASMVAAVEVFKLRPQDLERGMRAAGATLADFLDENPLVVHEIALIMENKTNSERNVIFSSTLKDLTKKVIVNKAETLRSIIREEYNEEKLIAKINLVIEEEGDILVRAFTNLSNNNSELCKKVYTNILNTASELLCEDKSGEVAHRAIVDAVQEMADLQLNRFLRHESTHSIRHLLTEARTVADMVGMKNEAKTIRRLLEEEDELSVHVLAADQITLDIIRRVLIIRQLAEKNIQLRNSLQLLRNEPYQCREDRNVRELVRESAALLTHVCPILSSLDIPSFLFELGNSLAMEDFLVQRIKKDGALLICKNGIQAVIPKEASRFVLSGLISYTLIDDKGVTTFKPMHVFNALKLGKEHERMYHEYSCVGAFDKYAYSVPVRESLDYNYRNYINNFYTDQCREDGCHWQKENSANRPEAATSNVEGGNDYATNYELLPSSAAMSTAGMIPVDIVKDMREEELEVALKVVIVGNGGVGKSSMIQRYCKGTFTKDYKKTIGVDFLERQIEIDGEEVRLMLWDTAGQEEFDAITKAYYRGAQACVLAFSTTDRDSFEAAHSWKLKVENECGEIPTVIVQNKIDLMDQSVVNPEEVELLARALGCRLLRTSVKEDVNVAAVFRHLASRCLAEMREPRQDEYNYSPQHYNNRATGGLSPKTISAFSPSHSAKSQNGTIVLRPNKHKKKKNVLKNACRIL